MHSPAITQLVIAALLFLLAGTASAIAVTLIGHSWRDRRMARTKKLMECYRPLVEGLLTGQIAYEEGRDALTRIGEGDHRKQALERILLATCPKLAQVHILRRLCEDLGLVEIWQRQLNNSGLSFLRRATAARNLGAIRHQSSWPLLVQGLKDPSRDVAEVSAGSLAAIGESESFPALVGQLQSAALDPRTALSLRTIRSALITFPLECAEMLLPSLEHTNARIRFLAVEVIRGMVERRAQDSSHFGLDIEFCSPQLTNLFLGRLASDESPDVRACATDVIAHLPDSRATAALVELLEDAEWPVRLHAVRALAQPMYSAEATSVARRLTDSHWRVREAAAKCLVILGTEGLHLLFRQFLLGSDKYCQEQIAEEIQRAGLLPLLLAEFSGSRDGEALTVKDQLSQLAQIDARLIGYLRSLRPAQPGASRLGERAQGAFATTTGLLK